MWMDVIQLAKDLNRTKKLSEGIAILCACHSILGPWSFLPLNSDVDLNLYHHFSKLSGIQTLDRDSFPGSLGFLVCQL